MVMGKNSFADDDNQSVTPWNYFHQIGTLAESKVCGKSDHRTCI